MPKFTPTEDKIMRLLSDGQGHTIDEMLPCLWDEQGAPVNAMMHISQIRKKLRPAGKDIICQRVDGKGIYRLVRLMASPNDGKR